jgi:cell division protein FtsN
MKNSKGMIILLVALATLTLVVVVGLFFFYPKDQAKTVAAAPAASGTSAAPATPLPNEFDPVEWTRNPQTTPIQTPAAGTPTDQGFTVTLPPESKAPSPQTLPPGTGVTFPGDAPAKPSTVKSTPVGESPKVAAALPAKTPAANPAAKPVKAVKVTEYWIQVGSFKDRYQAENTAKALENQGLKGTLSTATVNGQAVVRVRVGPYTNEAEAGKFLAWLKPVKEFDGSYITKASAKLQ